MENDLVKTIISAQEQDIPIKDICFSGNGEPTLSENFPAVIKRAEEIRKTMSPSSELVIITNGAGLLNSNIFSLLKNAANNPAINIWLKLDAGTQSWYEKINRSKIPFNELIKKIKEFVSVAPVTIQTMLCAIDGNPPSPAEDSAWVKLLKELTETDTIRKVQLYGKARSAPEDPKASELPEDDLNWRADSLESALRYTRTIIPVEVYL
jgi:histidinol dehydrogenase